MKINVNASCSACLKHLSVSWDENLSEGFRIYRSDFPGFPDFPAVDESKLGPGDDTWTDDSGNHCGEIYYIVAVYEDILTGAKEETDSAIDSWIPDEPCPPPP